MSCGLCAEVCPFDAIKMDHEFELATDMHGDLTIDRVGLLRPISYYEQLAPSFWAEVKDGALKKLQGAAKRRSGSIGIAPQSHRTESQEPRTESQEPRTESQEPRTESQEPRTTEPSALIAAPAITDTTPAVVPALPPVPVGDAKAEKAAKLAAIRAANTQKAGAATEAPAPTVEAAVLPISGDAKADKAAKLAAIRAANAKKDGVAAPAVVGPTDVPQASAAPIAAEAAVVVAPSVPVSGGDAKAEKAAKLAAIRAANAKKNENPEGTP
jgi:NADH-quinone oxidoreductase subunit I/electron transport complex protein RnfC